MYIAVQLAYYVYMILCENGSYYTGYTKNIELRFNQHKKGLGARYTRINRPKKVVHVEKFSTRVDAVRREREIKSMTHKRKLKLAS
ncbi:MAG: GIY-YIG nuclease family protein [Candidatus Bathyarchaeota archaeon]|nr:GIY-YIG nuclease family protein [Candidatus Bathyarchaeota archaeon]